MNGYIKQELVNRFPLRYCRHNFISSLVEEACLHSIFFIIAGGGDGCGKVSITRSIQQDTRDTIDFPSTWMTCNIGLLGLRGNSCLNRRCANIGWFVGLRFIQDSHMQLICHKVIGGGQWMDNNWKDKRSTCCSCSGLYFIILSSCLGWWMDGWLTKPRRSIGFPGE